MLYLRNVLHLRMLVFYIEGVWKELNIPEKRDE